MSSVKSLPLEWCLCLSFSLLQKCLIQDLLLIFVPSTMSPSVRACGKPWRPGSQVPAGCEAPISPQPAGYLGSASAAPEKS